MQRLKSLFYPPHRKLGYLYWKPRTFVPYIEDFFTNWEAELFCFTVKNPIVFILMTGYNHPALVRALQDPKNVVRYICIYIYMYMNCVF